MVSAPGASPRLGHRSSSRRTVNTSRVHLATTWLRGDRGEGAGASPSLLDQLRQSSDRRRL